MPVLFSNTASATLASSITSASTSITVSTGQGALFPAVPAGSFIYATLTDSSNNLEIVKVTARVADVFTVIRAQEGTTARAYATADRIEIRITAAGLANFMQLDGAQTAAGVKTFSDGVVANVTGNVTGNASGSAGSLVTTNFSVVESGGKLYIKYGATNIASIDSSGNIVSLANNTAYGTP